MAGVAYRLGFMDIPNMDTTEANVLLAMVAIVAAMNFNGEVSTPPRPHPLSTHTHIHHSVHTDCFVSMHKVLGNSQIPYSKFAPAGQVFSARVGWALMYAIPGLVYVGLWAFHTGMPNSLYHHMNLAVLAIHYGKRVFECLALHNYSKPPPMLTVLVVASFYSLGSGVHHFLANVSVTPQEAASSPVLSNSVTYTVPITVFAVGQVINLLHHSILASLRPAGSTAYVVPSGFLFNVAVCPHYLGELIAWFGVAMVARSVFSYGAWFTMVVYLSGRALHSHEWYRKKFDPSDFPPDRAALLPFVL